MAPGVDGSARSLNVHRYSLLRRTDANLTEARFESTLLGETVFVNTNLSCAIGLVTCTHIGPSTLDHRTLARSGTLPMKFLRGCGLADWLIEFRAWKDHGSYQSAFERLLCDLREGQR